MTKYVAIVLFIIVFAGSGCGKKGSPLSPQVPAPDFPQDTKFSVTLYSPSSTVPVGGTFEVRVVLYNVVRVSGMALEVTFPAASVEILGVTASTSFFPPDSIISISKIEPDSGRISFGASYKNTALGASKSGSGIACMLTCKAKTPGTASFVIVPTSLTINTPDGTLISDFASLLVENLSITIH